MNWLKNFVKIVIFVLLIYMRSINYTKICKNCENEFLHPVPATKSKNHKLLLMFIVFSWVTQ